MQIPIFPRPLALGLKALPAAPLTLPLTLLARRLIAANPGLIRRLGTYCDRDFLIDPTDLPLCLLLRPHESRARVSVHRTAPGWDARIAGPLAALLGLVHGAYDGDALFFSRDLVIEGDTAAALALRNAIDDAEIDLAGEITAMSGPFARVLRPLIDMAERHTGVALSRAEESWT